MYEATETGVRDAAALIMAAAVADYRPAQTADEKIKKGHGTLVLTLERTVDILGSLRGDFVRVGFAAESSDFEENARHKLEEKKLDLIAANDITSGDSGFGSDYNRVTIIDSKGAVERLPLLSKRNVADHIVNRVVKLLG
jgi:phosphopantothenoylcysteine decarboxylase/phosphopantothenate--cysteine ligase